MSNFTEYKPKLITSRESLLAMITHDLKNPISAGILALKLLQNPKLSPLNTYQKEILDNMYVGFDYMKNLLDNILIKYKFDSNAFILQKTFVDFNKLINEVLYEQKYLFTDNEQTINIKMKLTKNIIEIDELEIKRVIRNLISNASKYSPNKSIIEICIYNTSNQLHFEIKNPSRGKINAKTVFDEFITGKNTSKTCATGLGLYIVKQIISAHNGKVYLENVMDKFTKVTFTLPQN